MRAGAHSTATGGETVIYLLEVYLLVIIGVSGLSGVFLLAVFGYFQVQQYVRSDIETRHATASRELLTISRTR